MNIKSKLLACFILLYIPCLSANAADNSTLEFQLTLDRTVYEDSDYGEPPQMAIWLENLETGELRTVFVTLRTGTGDFEGTFNRPVSLPIWIGVYRKETGREGFPTPMKPFHRHITGATPQNDKLNVQAEVPEGSKWRYYIELNVSGDYTARFPVENRKGTVDRHGNGQPSLVYSGEINAQTGNVSEPKIAGRSRQHEFTTQMKPDLDGIESAAKVMSSVRVICK